MGDLNGQLSKAESVRRWRRVTADLVLKDDRGDPTCCELTGHTPRRVGAQWLAKRGVPLWQIMFVGRWGSATVERYVADSHAERLAGLACAAKPGLPVAATSGLDWWAVQEEFAGLRLKVGALTTDVRDSVACLLRQELQDDFRQLREHQARLIAEEAGLGCPTATQPSGNAASCFVTNLDTGVTNVSQVDGGTNPPRTWRTACGWHFAFANFQRAEVRGDNPCLRPGCALRRSLGNSGQNPSPREPDESSSNSSASCSDGEGRVPCAPAGGV